MAAFPAKKFGKDFTPHPNDLAEPCTFKKMDPRSSSPATVNAYSKTPASKRKTAPTTASSAPKRPASARRKKVSTSSQHIDTLRLRNDRLGTLVRELASSFLSSPSWETFVDEFRGRSYLADELDHIDHPAADLLRQWRDEGVPALSDSKPWTLEQKDSCVQRGCHKSANDHSEFLREEMAEFIESKHWMVLPYRLVRLLELFLAPAAVKEERERKPRLLCDLSWPWEGWSSVNEATVPHAPPESMQFGRTLARLLHEIRHANPRFGSPKLAKHDIKDGFYRMFLHARDCLRLALVLPSYEGEEPLIGIPLACPMGWVQSPPTFCTMSETVCDLANAAIRSNHNPSQHRLEELAHKLDDTDRSWTPRPKEPEVLQAEQVLSSLGTAESEGHITEMEIAPPSNCAFNRPLGTTDVFVDDFIQLAQGGQKRLTRLRACLLDAIDQVLAQPGSDSYRNEAVSLKKLLKGDGSWATRKIILGWLLDTVRQTIELPAHRKEALAEIFKDLATTRRVSFKKWQRYVGQLRFVSTAIPGSASMFSALQMALNAAKGNRVRITAALRKHIQAFASLAASLSHRPTHLAEIVPQLPSLLGATDAAKMGMGGVFFDHTGQGYVWRYPFPDDIQANLVSTDNLSGTVTNSDLEQAGLIGQLCVMSDHFHVRYSTIVNGTDNTPAVSRVAKGAVTGSEIAANLCHLAASHQRHHRYCHKAYYLPGEENVMADDASRLQHLTDLSFLSHFDQHYPQDKPWVLLPLKTRHASQMISALRSNSPTLPELEPPSTEPKAPLATGQSFVQNSTCLAPCITSLPRRPRSPTCSSAVCATGESVGRVSLQELKLSLPRLHTPGRAFPTWDTAIPESKWEVPSSIPCYQISNEPWNDRTTLPAALTL